MANTTINVQALTPEQRLHLPSSPALTRLGEILTARHQPWCEYQMGNKDKIEQKPYTKDDLSAAIAALEDYELSRAMVVAAFHGDLPIVREIWVERGPFETVHEKAQYHEIINGTAVRQGTSATHLLTNSASILQIRLLLQFLPVVGLGFMVGVGSEHALLLDSSQLETPIKHFSHASQYTGELPTLSNGVVRQTELLLALQERMSDSSFPEAYRDILCWVPDEEVAQFEGNLKPFKVHQGVHLIRQKTAEEGSGFHRQVFSFEECSEQLMNSVDRRSIVNLEIVRHKGTWDLNAVEMRVEPADGINGYPSEIVLGYQASEAIKHGFDHKPGHTLCHTTVDFLYGFGLVQINREKYQIAADFALKYVPLDLMALSKEGPDRFDAGCLRRPPGFFIGMGKGHSTMRDLYYALGDDSPIQDHVRKALPRPLIDFMISYHCHVNLDVRSMLGLKQGLGIDNTKFATPLSSMDLQKLHDSGYRFSDATVTHLPQRYTSTGRQLTYERLNSEDTEVYLNLAHEMIILTGGPEDEINGSALDNAYHNALRMNLWPAETPRPESLRKAIIQAAPKKKSGDTNNDKALRAYIDLEGVENCVKVTDSVSQLDFVRRHFGHNAVAPFLHLTTQKIRGHLLEDDLGL